MSRLLFLLNYRSNHLIIVIKALGFSVGYIKNSQGDLIRRMDPLISAQFVYICGFSSRTVL